VNIDYPASEHSVMSVKADKYADIRTLTYPAGSVDEVRNHHMFEHFTRAEALHLLLAWRKWLKADGILHIETPDFAGCARAYAWSLSRKRRFELGRHVFGSQEAGWAIHYDFWDKAKFKFVLHELGFKNIRVRRYANSFAKYYAHIPFANLIGRLIPERVYRARGGNKLPNIEVIAEKDAAYPLNDKEAVRRILAQYLVGRENEKLLRVWLADFDRFHGAQNHET